MMGRHRIYAQKGRTLNETDRLKLCELLIKAGYAAKLGKEKRPNSNTNDHFVVTYGQDGEKGTEYVTDFIVFLPDKTYRIVDVKGMKTRDFKLKMKSLREKYPRLKVELEE